MGLFGKKKKEGTTPDQKPVFATATLNDRIMPVDRGDVYEDPLNDFLEARKLGCTSGGGTMQNENGEIDFCDVEIEFNEAPGDSVIADVIAELESYGAPKGSKLTIYGGEGGDDRVFEFGRREGLAIYLDGVNLPDNVYEECDVNEVVDKIQELTGDDYDFVRYWTGPEDTALYFYNDKSFEEMSEAIAGFVAEYPLCKNSRIIRIA